jgi:hypothetical protein
VLHRLEREDAPLSLELDLDRDLVNVPLRTCLSDRPLGAPREEVLGNGVFRLISLYYINRIKITLRDYVQ